MFDREAAVLSCRAIAVLGAAFFAVGAPLLFLARTPRGWPSVGVGMAMVGVTLLVLSGLAALLMRRR
jgi:hypothetical protein